MKRVCSKCKKLKSLTEFTRRWTRKDTYNSQCRDCTRQYTRKHYDENKDYYLVKNQRRRVWIRSFIQNLRKKCIKCGETHIACLVFHHRDMSKKDINIGDISKMCWSKQRIIKEIKKCVVLCANCHRKKHWIEKLYKSSCSSMD